MAIDDAKTVPEKTIETKFGIASLQKTGYYMITNGEYKCKLLHRLIYEDHYGVDLDNDFPEKMQIHHINKIRWDNQIENLIMTTASEHRLHHKPSIETRKKMSENNAHYWKGKTFSEEHINKLVESHKNKKQPIKTLIKRSKSHNNSSGILRLHKHKNSFIYRYYDDNGKRKCISGSFLEIMEKVHEKKLEWVIVDEEKAKQTYKMYGCTL